MNIKSLHWEKENLTDIISKSKSKAEVLRKLGFKGYEGGHYRTLNKFISIYSLDTSHFLGQGWNIGGKFKITQPKPINEILIENSTNSTSQIKRRILKENIIPYSCSECGIFSWRDKQLSLHLDHINGEPTDNRIENLRFLCPNCHSQTSTYCKSKTIKNRNKNRTRGIRTRQPSVSKTESSANWDIVPDKNESVCAFCKKTINRKRKFCSSYCYHSASRYQNGGTRISSRKVERPSREKLKEDLRLYSICKIGRKYGVSDNAIRKWCKYYNINLSKK